MKAGTPSLNPCATSYIPLSNRGAAHQNEGHKCTTEDSKSAYLDVSLGLDYEKIAPFQYQNHPHNYDAHASCEPQIPDDSKLKCTTSYNSKVSPQIPNGIAKQTLDEEHEIDLAYLQMTFPDVAYDCISDVYMANNNVLEAAIDMLNQLELFSDDSFEDLPKSMDIGDMSEAGPSSNVAGGVGSPSTSKAQHFSQ